MTAAQESYLSTLAREAGEDVPGNLTKARASGADRPAARPEPAAQGQLTRSAPAAAVPAS